MTAIVWATGYALDFGWLKVDAFDEDGRPRHQRGVRPSRGSISWAALAVAARVVLHLGRLARRAVHRRPYRKQRGYLAYAPARREPTPDREGAPDGPYPHPHVQHPRHLPEQNLDNDLCQAVVARGTTIFLRGQCPQDLDTARTSPATIRSSRPTR